MHRIASSLLVALIVTVAGCGSGWVVVRQSNPDPLVGSISFSVADLTFDGPATSPEDVELSRARDRLAGRFRESVAKRARRKGLVVAIGVQPDTFVIRGRVTRLEPGHHRFVSTEPALVRLDVQLLDDKGAELDAIQVEADADAAYGDLTERITVVADQLGVRVADYLASRSR